MRHVHVLIAARQFIDHLRQAFLSRVRPFRARDPADVVVTLIRRRLLVSP